MVKISNYALLALLGHGATTAQAACNGTIASFSGTCDYASFSAALTSQSPDCDVTDIFGPDAVPADEVEALCELDAPVQFVEIQGTYQRDRRYFAGGGPLVDGGDWNLDSARLKRFANNVGDQSLIAFPNYAARVQYNINTGRATQDEPNGYPANMNLFNSCALQTMMCCFTDDSTDTSFAENGDATTDVCRHDLHDSPQSNHIKEGWSVFPGTEAETHCVGFTWTDGGEELLGNMMYDISYRNTAKKGYLKGIPGGPMCGCVEHMPVVAEASCRTATKTGDIEYHFVYDPEQTNKEYAVSAWNSATINYVDCAAGDLKAQYKANNAGDDAIDEHLVGKDGCAQDLEDYLNDEQFLHIGKHDTKYIEPIATEWSELVVGEGIYFRPPSLDDEANDEHFRGLINAGCGGGTRKCIIRRICSSCYSEPHRDIYYRRFTDFPPFGYNVTAGEEYLLDMFMNNWVKEGNDMALGDFKLYSSYQNALDDEDAWTYCAYGPTGGDNYGFPRNCGPSGAVYNQWNSYIRGHGDANHHGFYVELPQTP